MKQKELLRRQYSEENKRLQTTHESLQAEAGAKEEEHQQALDQKDNDIKILQAQLDKLDKKFDGYKNVLEAAAKADTAGTLEGLCFVVKLQQLTLCAQLLKPGTEHYWIKADRKLRRLLRITNKFAGSTVTKENPRQSK